MKKIVLSGEIGWDIMPFHVREEFLHVNGDDVEVFFSTPGGLISAGIEINSIFTEFKRENPSSQMIAHIVEANSMGSHLVVNPAFDLRTVELTSMGMIHNPQNGRIGDYRLMKKNADFLERLTGVMAIDYSKTMKNSMSETRDIMDSETWYVGGQALIDAGLADEMVNSNSKETKEAAFTKSELRFKSVMGKVKNHEITEDEFEKAIAMVDKTQQNQTQLNSLQPAAGGNNNNQEDVLMDLKELKEKHPEIYAEAIKAGQDEEKTGRAERVKALLEMKKRKDFEGIPEISERIDEGIEKDESIQSVELGIFAVFKKDGILAAMDTNNIGDINPPTGGSVSGEPAASKKDDKGEF